MSNDLDLDNERGWALLDQYAAGDLPPSDRDWMERWLARSPGARAAAAALTEVRVAPDGDRISFDVDGVRARVARQIVRESSVQRSSVTADERMRRVDVAAFTWWRRSLNGYHVRRFVSLAAASVAVALVGFFAFVRPSRDAVTTQTYTTNTGQQASVTFDDGSRAILAPETTMRLERVGTQTRAVTIDGEAYFEIARSPSTPFVVRSGNVTARVLGTAFLVRHYATDGRHVRIAVVEGKVQVTARFSRTAPTLTAGRVAEASDSVVTVHDVDDADSETGWVNGKLSFDNIPLERVLSTLSRWYGYQFRVTDSSLSRERITLVLSTKSSAAALANLEQLLSVNLTVVGDTVTLTPRSARTEKSLPRTRTYDLWTPTREVGR